MVLFLQMIQLSVCSCSSRKVEPCSVACSKAGHSRVVLDCALWYRTTSDTDKKGDCAAFSTTCWHYMYFNKMATNMTIIQFKYRRRHWWSTESNALKKSKTATSDQNPWFKTLPQSFMPYTNQVWQKCPERKPCWWGDRILWSCKNLLML